MRADVTGSYYKTGCKLYKKWAISQGQWTFTTDRACAGSGCRGPKPSRAGRRLPPPRIPPKSNWPPGANLRNNSQHGASFAPKYPKEFRRQGGQSRYEARAAGPAPPSGSGRETGISPVPAMATAHPGVPRPVRRALSATRPRWQRRLPRQRRSRPARPHKTVFMSSRDAR